MTSEETRIVNQKLSVILNRQSIDGQSPILLVRDGRIDEVALSEIIKDLQNVDRLSRKKITDENYMKTLTAFAVLFTAKTKWRKEFSDSNIKIINALGAELLRVLGVL